MKRMKRMYFFGLAVLLVLGGALTANAATVLDPWPAGGGGAELNLNDIVQNPTMGGLPAFASSQAFVDFYGTLETLPAGSLTILGIAKFSAFTQQPGIYKAGGPGRNLTFGAPIAADGIAATNFAANPTLPFGFLDDINGGTPGVYRVYTETAQNADFLQHGIIIPVAANRLIVAFEDGAGLGQLFDSDYNDLVLNVRYTAAPVPPAALLMGSGLLGLIGIRRFRTA